MAEENETQAAEETPDEKTVTLRKKITFGKLEFTEVSLREPTAGELERAQRVAGSVAQAINLISEQSKIPRRAVELMSQRDLQECNDFLASFSAERVQTPPFADEPSPS